MSSSISIVPPAPAVIHPAWLRAAHWTNAAGVLLMVASGWRIYNASPLFAFKFPGAITLGGWLGGALQWHFAAMWLLVLNGLCYAALNLAKGRAANGVANLDPATLRTDLQRAVRGELVHDASGRYNAIQAYAYLFAMLDLVLLVLSGLVLWKSVQFPVLRELLGGYEMARRIHFFAMLALVAFAAGHVAMALLVPRTILAMVRGK